MSQPPAPLDRDPVMMLIAEPGEAGDLAARQATDSGYRLAARIPGAQAAARLASQAGADLVVVVTTGIADAVLPSLFDAVEAAVGALDARLVVLFDEPQLDRIAGRHWACGPVLLCDPTPGELVVAFARTPTLATLHDKTRDSEAERLRRLNEEVARIADTLARLARSEPGDPPSAGLRDRTMGYGGPPATGAQSSVTAPRVRAAIRARRMRDQFFESALFADPAWDMLLDLFAAELEHSRVSVSSLCIAAAVPPTTALRWITTMTDAGLLGREPDPEDRRRAFVTLAAPAGIAMRQLIAGLDRAGLAIP